MHEGKGVAIFVAIGMPKGKLLQQLKRRKNGKKRNQIEKEIQNDSIFCYG